MAGRPPEDEKPKLHAIDAILNGNDLAQVETIAKAKGYSLVFMLLVLIDNFDEKTPVVEDRAVILGKRWHEDKSIMKRVSLKLPEDKIPLKEKVKNIAQANEVSDSVVIRQIIREYLQGCDEPREFKIAL